MNAHLGRWRARLLAVAGLALLIGAFLAAIQVGTSGGGPSPRPAATPAEREGKARAARGAVKPQKRAPVHQRRTPALVPRRLVAVAAYDPDGDGHENDGAAAEATDGDPATAWSTEHYRSFAYKSGVGLVLDAGRPVKLARLVVVSDTPGFVAEVAAGSSPQGPFSPVSAGQAVGSTTAFALEESDAARYRMIWITSLGAESGGVAHVNEVRALMPREAKRLPS